MPEVVIVDRRGVEHVFPDGFNPQRAAQIVRQQGGAAPGAPAATNLDLAADTLKGYGTGLVKGAASLVDPGSYVQGIKALVSPMQTARGIRTLITEGSAGDLGEAIGEMTGAVGTGRAAPSVVRGVASHAPSVMVRTGDMLQRAGRATRPASIPVALAEGVYRGDPVGALTIAAAPWAAEKIGQGISRVGERLSGFTDVDSPANVAAAEAAVTRARYANSPSRLVPARIRRAVPLESDIRDVVEELRTPRPTRADIGPSLPDYETPLPASGRVHGTSGSAYWGPKGDLARWVQQRIADARMNELQAKFGGTSTEPIPSGIPLTRNPQIGPPRPGPIEWDATAGRTLTESERALLDELRQNVATGNEPMWGQGGVGGQHPSDFVLTRAEQAALNRDLERLGLAKKLRR